MKKMVKRLLPLVAVVSMLFGLLVPPAFANEGPQFASPPHLFSQEQDESTSTTDEPAEHKEGVYYHIDPLFDVEELELEGDLEESGESSVMTIEDFTSPNVEHVFFMNEDGSITPH